MQRINIESYITISHCYLNAALAVAAVLRVLEGQVGPHDLVAEGVHVHLEAVAAQLNDLQEAAVEAHRDHRVEVVVVLSALDQAAEEGHYLQEEEVLSRLLNRRYTKKRSTYITSTLLDTYSL